MTARNLLTLRRMLNSPVNEKNAGAWCWWARNNYDPKKHPTVRDFLVDFVLEGDGCCAMCVVASAYMARGLPHDVLWPDALENDDPEVALTIADWPELEAMA